MIDEQVASQAVDVFIRACGGRWSDVRTEIQDDGEYLLLSVEVPLTDVAEIDPSVRSAVAIALNALISLVPEEPTGNWIVGLMHNGNVYDSILAIDF
jgi:hypothetical protein